MASEGRRQRRRAWGLAALGAAAAVGAGHLAGIPAGATARGVGYAASAWFLARGVAIVLRHRLIDLRAIYITQTSILATSFAILALLTMTGYTAPRDGALPWPIWAWIGLFLLGAILGFEALVRAGIRSRMTGRTRTSPLPPRSREEADTLLDLGRAEIRHARDAPGVQFGASQEAIGRLVATLGEWGYLDDPGWIAEQRAKLAARQVARRAEAGE